MTTKEENELCDIAIEIKKILKEKCKFNDEAYCVLNIVNELFKAEEVVVK